jgi:hypothetical protein
MALPKLDTPTYTLELPSTGEEIKYRPFLVKEQKTLMILQESEDNKKDIYNALTTMVTDCTFNNVNVDRMPVFDFEYVFLKIRCKSVGETAELNILCPDDDETRVPVTINLDEIDVQVSDEHVNSVQVSDNISMILRWPTIKDVSNIGTDDIVDSTMKLLQTCITEVIDGDTVHRRSDFNSEELNEFIDSLPFECFEQIGNFFQTMPKLLHMVKVKNPKTNVESEVKLEGIDNFF